MVLAGEVGEGSSKRPGRVLGVQGSAWAVWREAGGRLNGSPKFSG